MLANFEQRSYSDYGRVWIGSYLNLHNLAHWHLEHELIYVKRGQVCISYNDESYVVAQGSLALVRSGQVHYIDGEEGSIVDIVMYDDIFLPEHLKQYTVQHVVLTSAYSFVSTFLAIEQEQHTKESFYIEHIHLLLESFLIELYRKEPVILQDQTQKNDMLPEYKRLLRIIQKSYSDITFEKAATIMGLSDSYFSRYFHKMSGMTFSKYLNTIRIEKAIELLKGGEHSITELSYLCGFSTIRHFNRVFKELTGIAPKAMPKDFMLYHHTTKMLHDSFDPTSKDSILL